MKRQIIIGAVAVAALAGGAWSVQAGPAPDIDEVALHEGCGERSKVEPEQRLARMAKKLKLTAAQKEKAGAILKAEKERIAPLREKLAENRLKLKEAAQAATFDEAAVRAIATDQAQLEIELTVSRTRLRSQINALLTPEQRELADKLEPRRKGGKGRHPRLRGEG